LQTSVRGVGVDDVRAPDVDELLRSRDVHDGYGLTGRRPERWMLWIAKPRQESLAIDERPPAIATELSRDVIVVFVIALISGRVAPPANPATTRMRTALATAGLLGFSALVAILDGTAWAVCVFYAGGLATC
jgi:hypothetical protein